MECKKTGTIIFIIFLILIVLGLGGFIAYDKFFAKKETSNLTTIDNVSIDLNTLYQVGDILNMFDAAYNNLNSNYFGYIYHSKKIEVANFDKGAALFLAAHKEIVGSNTPQVIQGGRVKKNYEKIFGKSLAYEPNHINAGDYYKLAYDATNDKFSYTIPAINNVYTSGYRLNNIKTKLKEDSIVVTRKLYFVEYASNAGGTDITKANIYTASGKEKKLGEVSLKNGVLSEKEVMSKYSSKLFTFELTFKQSDDGEYHFYKIERTN